MKKWTTEQMRKIADECDPKFKMPIDIAKKYNLTHTPDIFTNEEGPSGRAWVMWFFDLLDDRPKKRYEK